MGAVEILSERASWTRLLDHKGNEYLPVVERWRMEENGPFRASLLAEGNFLAQSRKPALSFKARLAFFAGSAAVRILSLIHIYKDTGLIFSCVAMVLDIGA